VIPSDVPHKASRAEKPRCPTFDHPVISPVATPRSLFPYRRKIRNAANHGARHTTLVPIFFLRAGFLALARGKTWGEPYAKGRRN
jgi:hypothetical protein